MQIKVPHTIPNNCKLKLFHPHNEMLREQTIDLSVTEYWQKLVCFPGN